MTDKATDTMHDQLTDLLDNIENELQTLSLWDSQPPPSSAFESSTPFFADKMAFQQWIQWVFIARFRALIEGNLPLPAQCGIAPMAEEAFKGNEQDVTRLLKFIRDFDAAFPD